jgi:leader peptidase (prepilin peptidase)/N-methyltransferase
MAGSSAHWSVYWLFKLVTGKEGMGYGDFKLLAALGAWLGWQQLPMIILGSSLVGVVFGLIQLRLKKQGIDKAFPFGPYLAIAGWISMMWGDQIWNWYLTQLLGY